MSSALTSSFVTLVKQRQALPARHSSTIISGDAFHFGPMRSFFVPRITQNHAVIIEGVQVAFLSFVPGHRPHPVSMPPNHLQTPW
jgi:hypothetical protein